MPQVVERLGNNPPKNPCATGCGACPFAGGGCPLRSAIGLEGSAKKPVKVITNLSEIGSQRALYVLKPVMGGDMVKPVSSGTCSVCAQNLDKCRCEGKKVD